MRLKKLILQGFKSFADRTEFTFDENLTGIVGPNGCGKSNIVDAFKWVLGEQSAKSLRGKQMADVIFNGSANRRSMGMSEVSLVLQNSSELSNDLGEEITITRRLYRSGQSEYLINNKQVRLKDIRDIILDTGMGVDAYSLIEQGKVDLLLQASNEERRAVLEEAAGISKYRVRKKEAQRKLENVQQNLLRLEDIITEVERQLRSVKLQAGKARNYQQYKTRLNELKSQYYLAEYHNLIQNQGELRKELDSVNENLTLLKAEQSKLESEQSRLNLELVKRGNQISDIENKLAQLQGKIDTGRKSLILLHRRISELSDYLKNRRDRLLTVRTELTQILTKRENLKEKLKEITAEQQIAEVEFSSMQNELKNYESICAELIHKIETEKSNIIEIMRQSANLNNQISQTNLQEENIRKQKQKLIERKNHLSEEKNTLIEKINTYKNEYEQLHKEKQQNEETLRSLQEEYDQLTKEAESVRNELASLKEKRSALRSRIEVLTDMENTFQGIDEGVRKILESPEYKELSENATLVADIIKTNTEYAKIIEAALKGKEQYLIVKSTDQFLQFHNAIDSLGGKTSFYLYDMLPPIMNVREFSQFDGVIGRAVDFLTPEEGYEHLVNLLLGKTIIVKDLETAIKLHREDTTGTTFVTLNCELVEPDGSVHFRAGDGTIGLISRKTELNELSEKVEKIDFEITEIENRLTQLSLRQQELTHHLQETKTRIYKSETKLIELQTNINNTTHQLKKSEQNLPFIDSELSTLEEQKAFLNTQKEKYLHQLKTKQAEQEQIKTTLSKLEEEFSYKEDKKRKIEALLTNKKVKLAELAERQNSLAELINSLTQQVNQIEADKSAIEQEIFTTLEKIEQTERHILQTENELAQNYLSKESYQYQSANLRTDREKIKNQLLSISEEINKIKEKVTETQNTSHELALKINELTVRQETLIQRVYDELGTDLEAMHSDYRYVDQDWDAIAREIEELKGKISRLGNVNLDAITEQEQLEARLVFLKSQKDDLTAAKEKLEQLIIQLDEESEKRFIETFEAVQTNFHELFRKLFGGGKAELILDNPENVLESGIDIIARPPGKESRSISLLSGGEKTLTTVALLMAIFKSRPAPFCILDEVDAALDEANVDRFNLVLQEFTKDSQFIIITHNKRTMSYMNTLYGITMQEAGVSKVVAVKFDNKSQPAKEEPEAA